MARIGIMSAVGFLLLFLPLHQGIAEEKREKGAAKVQPVTRGAKADTLTVKVSEAWMDTVWRRVSELTAKERAFEVERATATAGVRGVPEETEDRLYYKEEDQVPCSQEVRSAIDLLKANIAEALYFIGQCYVQLGEKEEALSAYNQLVREHPKSEWAKRAQKEIECLEKQGEGQ